MNGRRDGLDGISIPFNARKKHAPDRFDFAKALWNPSVHHLRNGQKSPSEGHSIAESAAFA